MHYENSTLLCTYIKQTPNRDCEGYFNTGTSTFRTQICRTTLQDTEKNHIAKCVARLTVRTTVVSGIKLEKFMFALTVNLRFFLLK